MTNKTVRHIAILLLAAATARPEDPHIGYVYPAGGQQGSSFEVVVGGQHLDNPTVATVSGDGVQAEVLEHIRPLNQGAFKYLQSRVSVLQQKDRLTAEEQKQLTEMRKQIATFSIRKYSVPALVESVTLKVTVAPDAVRGRRELRLMGENGLSNPLVFCVGQLPEITEESARTHAVEQSQRRGGRGKRRRDPAEPDPSVNPAGNLPATDQLISLPAVVNGQILPGNTDRYRFRADKGMQLIVEVSARGLIPYLSDAVPGWFQAVAALVDSDGNEIAYEDDFFFRPDPVLQCEIPEDGEYAFEIRDALNRGREDFVYRVRISESTGRAPQVKLGESDLEEAEPNNTPAAAQPVTGPVIIGGRIDSPGDFDIFRLSGRPGAQMVAEIKARRLGSPVDSALMAITENGKQLAANDDFEDRSEGLVTHHADSRIEFTMPPEGTCLLHLMDTQHRGGPASSYRLHIHPPEPDFALRVVPSAVNARAGTTVPFTVHAFRRDGFDSDITLNLKNPPTGFELSGGQLPAGQDRIQMTLTVPEDAPPTWIPLKLEGRAKIHGRETVRQAVAADDTMQAFIYRHLVPAETLQVAVTEASRAHGIRLVKKKTLRIRPGGRVRIPVELPRRTIFGELRFELHNPPPGISIEETDFEKGQIILCCDKETCQPRSWGNLIINALAVRTGEGSGKGRQQRIKKRILLTALPAIPFEIRK